MTDLDEFAAKQPRTKQGFAGVMDRIDPADKQQVIDGYAKGYSGPTIRRWLQEKYPDIRFTASNVDLWLSKHHPRFTRV